MEIAMVIELLTKEKASIESTLGNYMITYKPLKRGQNSTIELLITGLESYSDTSVRSGCSSCTTATIKRTENSNTIKITYDTMHTGSFLKSVTFFHKQKPTKINFQGVVTP